MLKAKRYSFDNPARDLNIELDDGEVITVPHWLLRRWAFCLATDLYPSHTGGNNIPKEVDVSADLHITHVEQMTNGAAFSIHLSDGKILPFSYDHILALHNGRPNKND